MKIEWNDIKDDKPLDSKDYLVTVRNTFSNQTYMKVAFYKSSIDTWQVTWDEKVLAWAEVEPFVKDKEFEVGDIVKDEFDDRVGMIVHIETEYGAYRPYHIIWDTGCCWDYTQSDMEIFKRIDNNSGLVNKVLRELNFIKDEEREGRKND